MKSPSRAVVAPGTKAATHRKVSLNRQESAGSGSDTADLYEAIARLKDTSELGAFLDDLCTPAEIVALADRWKVARLLSEGMPYREIYEKTGVSTATVTRVARALAFGAGGYRSAMSRLERTTPLKTKARS